MIPWDAFAIAGAYALGLAGGWWLGLRHAARIYSRQMRLDPTWAVSSLVTTVGKENLRRLIRKGVPL